MRLIILCILSVYPVISSFSQFEPEIRKSTYVGGNYFIIGDFNGDRIDDIAIHDNSSWKALYGTYDGLRNLSDIIETGSAINNGVWAGDFNGDGFCDKVTFVNSTDKNREGWWVSESYLDKYLVHHFAAETRWSTSTAGDNFTIGDFNGDGKDDIAYHYLAEGTDQFNVLISGNDRFTSGSPWLTGYSVYNGLWSGDFNGDGYSDLAIFQSSMNRVYVLINDRHNGFLVPVIWSSEISGDNLLVGDFNGDSKDDIAFHFVENGNNKWMVMLSNSSHFQTDSVWAAGSGINDGVWAGDFNGDGYYDKITYVNSPDTDRQGWWLSYSRNNKRLVGVWYTGGDWKDHDPEKIPVAGWGSDEIAGQYTSQDPAILRRQFYAMKKANIDFIVIGMTNGYGNKTSPGPVTPYFYDYKHSEQFIGEKKTTNVIPKMFNTMNKIDPDYQIPLSIGLGFEFWGPFTLCYFFDNWDGWDNQEKRQEHALNYIKNNFINLFPNLYFKHLGKPLIVSYISEGLGYPMRNPHGSILPLPYYPFFTLRYALGWHYSYSHYEHDSARCAPSYKFTRTIAGMEAGGYWGWGSGPADSEPTLPLPRSKELMSIMPGTTHYNVTPPHTYINRRDGEFYINSWCQVLEVMPSKVLIADWNNWTEETAIEKCIGPHGWGDLYLKITKYYAFIYKNDRLPSETIYIKDKNHPAVYRWDGSVLTHVYKVPKGEPRLILPPDWLSVHNYFKTD